MEEGSVIVVVVLLNTVARIPYSLYRSPKQPRGRRPFGRKRCRRSGGRPRLPCRRRRTCSDTHPTRILDPVGKTARQQVISRRLAASQVMYTKLDPSRGGGSGDRDQKADNAQRGLYDFDPAVRVEMEVGMKKTQ